VGKKDNQSGSKNQINNSKSVYKTVNSFSSNVTGGKDFKLLTENTDCVLRYRSDVVSSNT
jgi:hypothetical protein